MEGQKGSLIISLDFELIWGVFDKVDPKAKLSYFNNTRKVIPQILKLFEKYEISCTWAVVGMLFHSNWQDWENSKPAKLPGYTDLKLSPYLFGERVKNTESENLFFAPELIRLISKTRRQEIGTHTYSHYYCKEKGQTIREFELDLEKAIEVANASGIEINSLVFPRNQFNEDYLRVCLEKGIKNVRSNPENWYWKDPQNSSLITKIFRTGDAYLGKRNKSYSYSELRKSNNGLLEQKASRLFKPYSSNPLMNYLKIRRIKSEMTLAAKKDQVYHLWWHPHNFGEDSKENLTDLISVLEHFRNLNLKYGFQSKNMQDIYDLIK